jgi:2-oxo-3-hexenedioate decarboxylase
VICAAAGLGSSKPSAAPTGSGLILLAALQIRLGTEQYVNPHGLKAGLTSFAKMKQMGVQTPVFGFMADYMGKPDGGEIRTSELIHPKVEAEICIVTKSDLQGPGCTIADNTSASRFVVGGRARAVAELDLRTLGVVLEKNGEIVATATGAAVLGNPLAAVAMMADHLTARGQLIPAGTFIMTGGVTEAIPVQAGDHIAVQFHALGMVSMRFA